MFNIIERLYQNNQWKTKKYSKLNCKQLTPTVRFQIALCQRRVHLDVRISGSPECVLPLWLIQRSQKDDSYLLQRDVAQCKDNLSYFLSVLLTVDAILYTNDFFFIKLMLSVQCIHIIKLKCSTDFGKVRYLRC